MRKKALALTLMMALFFIMGSGVNTTLNAQRNDNFFRTNNNEDIYSNRDVNVSGSMSLGNAEYENPTAPLGSGLLIMVAAGAGYVVARRKNISKFTRKSTSLLLALALVLGMTQCKKSPVTPTNNNNGLYITLNAGQGTKGDRTDFTPVSFVWTVGATERIYVGGSEHPGTCLGVLSGMGTGTKNMSFNGTLKPTPDVGETLYFFYLGKGRDGNPVTTLDFSNQDGINVTNCHIAIGSETYTGQTSFSAYLNMAMAIAYFDLHEFNDSKTAETVYLSGDAVYSTATINYEAGTISGNSKGLVKVGTANTGENPGLYVALIPSVSSSKTLQFNSNSKTGSITFTSDIQAGKYYAGNNYEALKIDAAAGTGIPGAFSVSASKKVFFSKGNLQYQASTGTWRFAEHQYDAIGNAAGNTTTTDRDKQSYWIDLFGWGTSGWNNGNTYYHPYDYIGSISSSAAYGYGPKYMVGYQSKYEKSLVDEYADADWGVYNTIEDYGTGWRTLTGGATDDSEWKYLFDTRSASTVAGTENARFVKAKVNDVKGVIIFPDVYNHPNDIPEPTNINNKGSSLAWTSVITYTAEQWMDMESAGAVFLPCTGYRSWSSNNLSYSSDDTYYWSSTVYNTANACAVYVRTSITTDSYYAKRNGGFVRLVKDVE